MDVILCHLAADFDTLGAAVGAARLYPGARILLTGGSHPMVTEFLSLHRNAFPVLDLRAVDPQQLRRVILVDCHDPGRLGQAAAWLDQPEVEVHLYDHHPYQPDQISIPNLTQIQIEPVGSTCTLMVERLQKQQVDLSPFEITALGLGIHMDTGSLTFPETTVRDAQALTTLLAQGLNLTVLAQFLDGGLSDQHQDRLCQGLDQIQVQEYRGYQLAAWVLRSAEFIPGLAGVVMRLMELTGVDVLIVGAVQGERLSLIGRSRHRFAQLHQVLSPYGGGGHAQAAAATCRDWERDPEAILRSILQQIQTQIPPPITARALMSSPVRTIRPDTSITEAQRVLLRYGHSGLVVANDQAQWVGVISRRDIDIALHHGFGHAPVKGYMTTTVRTITPETPIAEIRDLMTQWDIGRLPVVDQGHLLGIVTRTDVLRHLHDLPRSSSKSRFQGISPKASTQAPQISASIALDLLPERYRWILDRAAEIADELGVRLYLVGGAVRDLLLGRGTEDLDLVVDGSYPLGPDLLQEGWGVILGRQLHRRCPEAKLEIHGKFQTVALTWPDGVWIDIATARTEFYPYPAAAPEVSLGSIQQDLYRRDFTINALALRLNGAEAGQILDFFGGLEDLRSGVIRVLHANSFIEDPTRILRAVRFGVRLGFEVDDQTRRYIVGALSSGLHDAVGGDRLKNELFYILKADRWWQAFDHLAAWGALRCIHPNLMWTPQLQRQVRRVGAWMVHFARFYPEIHPYEIEQVRLEVMLAQVPGSVRVADQLQLTQAGIDRLEHLPRWRQEILPQLSTQVKPSQILNALQSLKVMDLMLLVAIADPEQRRMIYRYLQEWRRLKPLLNGHDLRQMGYQPGPDYQQILGDLRVAMVDGEIEDREQALRFVRDRYPETH